MNREQYHLIRRLVSKQGQHSLRFVPMTLSHEYRKVLAVQDQYDLLAGRAHYFNVYPSTLSMDAETRRSGILLYSANLF